MGLLLGCVFKSQALWLANASTKKWCTVNPKQITVKMKAKGVNGAVITGKVNNYSVPSIALLNVSRSTQLKRLETFFY